MSTTYKYLECYRFNNMFSYSGDISLQLNFHWIRSVV